MFAKATEPHTLVKLVISTFSGYNYGTKTK